MYNGTFLLLKWTVIHILLDFPWFCGSPVIHFFAQCPFVRCTFSNKILWLQISTVFVSFHCIFSLALFQIFYIALCASFISALHYHVVDFHPSRDTKDNSTRLMFSVKNGSLCLSGYANICPKIQDAFIAKRSLWDLCPEIGVYAQILLAELAGDGDICILFRCLF